MKRLLICCVILTLGSPASAQYFGRNKVRYRTFDFQVLKTEHFDIYFYESEREGVEIAARLAERWYGRLERLFDHTLSKRQPLILYASHVDFEQTNVIPEEIDEGTGGVTEPGRRRIVLPLAGAITDTDHVIGHELVHAFQFDIVSQMAGNASLERLPLWFVEGMAEYVSLGRADANTAMKVRDALRSGRIPTIQELDSPAFFPYQWGHAVWAYIAGRYGDSAIPRLLTTAVQTGSVDAAFTNLLGASAKELSNDWRDAIQSAYSPLLSATKSAPGAAPAPLVQTRGFWTDLNVGPAFSPNGRWVAFLSSRGVFSTDLYVADAMTGHIVRKYTSTANDPHFSSLEFIHSAGAWDASSTHIVMATVVSGRPALAIFNVRTGRREREIELKGIDEALNPAWSPDGHAIAFTAMRQGLTDLYVYELNTATLVQVTNDAYADLQPAWAPDNRRIVFVSDRFSTDLASLRTGDLQLAVVDTASREAQPVPVPDMPDMAYRGSHINPQWSADGESIYFIGAPDGVPNVYRLSIASHRVDQFTMFDTGVSGITASSPALSLSRETGKLAVSVFLRNRYDIYVREADQHVEPIRLAVNAAALPPTTMPSERLPDQAHAIEGLPDLQTYPTTRYKPKLSLSGVGQPTIGVGVGQFGTVASGGTALLFADMLGDQLLAATFQLDSGLNGSFRAANIAAQAEYLNLARRWNWGFAGGQIPYISQVFQSELAVSADNDLVEIDRGAIYRQTERSGAGIFSYPFNRSRRVEFRGGLSRTTFEQTVETTITSLTTGTRISDTTTELEVPHMNLVSTAAALVGDRTNYGPVGPVQGERYRMEVAPVFGSLNFTGVLVDYRRYFMPLPFYTLAARVIHYGRYGEGGDDPRLYPVYINNPALVRGYDSLGYTVECDATGNDCRSINRLAGSRTLVGNVELRFPLFRPIRQSRGMYGPVPVEVALFADAGTAWTKQERPAFLGGTRPGIASAGVAFRLSLGIVVMEFDGTRPFHGPDHGWQFGFNLIPAW